MSMRGWTAEHIRRLQANHGSANQTPATWKGRVRLPKGPNKTEIEALAVLGLSRVDSTGFYARVSFESETFRVVDHDYTPDWVGRNIAVEVKGEHILSRDSRILFDAARLAHPELTWIWARKRTKGKRGPHWQVEIYPRKI